MANNNPTGKGGFQKGRSGNPSGRPKIDGYLRDLAREHTDQAWQVILEALGSQDERIRLRAAELVMERGYGKAPQSLEAKVTTKQDLGAQHLEAVRALSLISKAAVPSNTDITEATDRVH